MSPADQRPRRITLVDRTPDCPCTTVRGKARGHVGFEMFENKWRSVLEAVQIEGSVVDGFVCQRERNCRLAGGWLVGLLAF